MKTELIVILSQRELDKMRQAGRLAAKLLQHLEPFVKPGVSTLELNDEAERWTQAHGAKSAPLGYKGYPKSICTSVNEVICHGIPNAKQILKDGDIINIDVTPIVEGYHGDTSKTFFVGTPSPKTRKLVEVTEECLRLGIAEVKPGARIGDIGAAIQEYAEGQGFSVVRDFVGHGISNIFHTAPDVPHYGTRGKGKRLRPGMVFTIEPMINEGTYEVEVLGDKWTAVTRDRKLSAQCEHTLAVTEDGVEILTLPEGNNEQVAGLINRKLNVAIELLNLPWFIPMKCLIKPLGQNSAFRPDVVILDQTALANEPLWKTEPVITLGKSVKLIVEVVSTNWQNDYARKVEDYEALGVGEYWIADYLGLGGKRYIGLSKQPVITIYQLVDGIYQGQQFRGTERLISQTFPDLNLTAEQIFVAGR